MAITPTRHSYRRYSCCCIVGKCISKNIDRTVTTTIRLRFDGRSTKVIKVTVPTTSARSHADIFVYLGRTVVTNVVEWSYSAVELQSYRSRIVVAATALETQNSTERLRWPRYRLWVFNILKLSCTLEEEAEGYTKDTTNMCLFPFCHPFRGNWAAGRGIPEKSSRAWISKRFFFRRRPSGNPAITRGDPGKNWQVKQNHTAW